MLVYKNTKNAFFLKFIFKNIFIGKSPLVETDQLIKLLKDSKTNLNNVKIIDCTLYQNEGVKNEGLIPHSIYLNPMDLSENKQVSKITRESLGEVEVINPFNPPSEETFTNIMKLLNIKKSDLVICYDKNGIYSSARMWFMFRLFQVRNVYVLNGGFPKWKKEKHPIVKEYKQIEPFIDSSNQTKKVNLFSFKKDESKLITTDDMIHLTYNMIKNKSKDDAIDTRAIEKFNGEVEDTFPTLRKGSFFSCASLHFKLLVNEEGCLKTEEEILALMNERQINLDNIKSLAVFSGVGLSACICLLALDRIGKFDKVKFYSGGWLEMGNVYENGHPILQKLMEYEKKSTSDQVNEIVTKMGPDYQERVIKQNEFDYKMLDVKEKNFEYLKKKQKIKKKMEGDYTSPEEMF